MEDIESSRTFWFQQGYIHEQTCRKRIPVDIDGTTATATTEIDANVQTATIEKTYKSYYAIPSGRTMVVLDDKVRTESLLDDGSELNLMAEDLYSELGHLIDSNIRWRINGFDSRIE